MTNLKKVALLNKIKKNEEKAKALLEQNIDMMLQIHRSNFVTEVHKGKVYEFRKFTQDFIDEDTNEVVSIDRKILFAIDDKLVNNFKQPIEPHIGYINYKRKDLEF